MDAVATPPDYIHPQISIEIKDSDSVDIQSDNWNTTYSMPTDKKNLQIGTNSGNVEQISVEYNIGQVRYYFKFYN